MVEHDEAQSYADENVLFMETSARQLWMSMIFSWQLVRHILFEVPYFSAGREEELVRGQAIGTAVCKWVECDPFQDLNLFIFLDVWQVVWNGAVRLCSWGAVRSWKCLRREEVVILEFVWSELGWGGISWWSCSIPPLRAYGCWLCCDVLTPWSRVLLDKLTVNFAASQEIPRIYGTRNFLTIPRTACHLLWCTPS
jgi:hypothetical protein